jgi:hypothetical protein
MNRTLVKYLARRASVRPLCGREPSFAGLEAAVVIPALAERATLPVTLASLAANSPLELERTLVLVVVNNRALGGKHGAAPEDCENNQQTLAWLAEFATTTPLRLAWIDASSPGLEMPGRSGVGLARKIGCDSCLQGLADDQADDLVAALKRFRILHMDGDTLVVPNYLSAVRSALTVVSPPGLSIAYRHQPADTPEGQSAIDQYERYLDHYVAGLRRAGSPYAFQTVGSAMACTADAYLKVGGIPAKRQAGEDFYFLQELAKNCGVRTLEATVVHPSARSSRRVPFGTGYRILQALEYGESEFLGYDPRTFAALRELLQAVETGLDRPAGAILGSLNVPESREFLEAREFRKIWSGFQQQYAKSTARLQAFHRWFDGFVTLKFIHYLTEQAWPKIPLAEACANQVPVGAFE